VTDIADQRTWTSTETAAPVEEARTRASHDLVEETGHLRNQARIVNADVTVVHHRALDVDLRVRARSLVKRPAQDLLNELADEGFSWRDIAALVRVSVPALRRWRQGESPTPQHLLGIARVVALVETLQAEPTIPNVASWLEVPLAPEAPLTGIDLAVDGRYELVVDLAAEHRTPEEVLDYWRPGWRDAYRSEFEVFEAPDGELGIRPVSTGE
jgi:transcriptional regulator with XRE-family HTH domain